MRLQQLGRLNRSTIALIAAAVAVAGGSFYYSVSQFGRNPAETVPSSPAQEPIAALGRLEPVSEVVSLSVSTTLRNDRVKQLLVQRGDRVQANQVIAILESHDRLQAALLEAQEQVWVAESRLAQVRAGAKSGEIAAQQAEVARLQQQLQGEVTTQAATLARRQAEVEVAQTEYDRYLTLYQQGAVAASTLDQRRLTLATAQAQLNEVQANRNRTAETLQTQIRQAQSTLNQIAEVRPVDVQTAQAEVRQAAAAVQRAQAELNEAIIRAPISGKILEVHTQSGEAIAEAGIVDLGNTNQMEVVAEVYQSDIHQVRNGQVATITSDAFTGELQGTVHQLGQQVNQQKVFSRQPGENLDRRVVEVRIRLNATDSQRVANLTNLQVQVAIQSDYVR
ncbi:MAG: HlyD family efflux transporter periplasmic adaptor subunit [Leptolyngbya sp. IPPAS B-1204]|nr:HlyD family efflux transporter periplasmic adaptor subunit [Elainella sp. C42_A2020_010]RNJ65111.1 MAG: HlyD family efflux transporter periplasmic adaptor subunit [Leptolyngbya sp. IPPAS B-1204]